MLASVQILYVPGMLPTVSKVLGKAYLRDMMLWSCCCGKCWCVMVLWG